MLYKYKIDITISFCKQTSHESIRVLRKIISVALDVYLHLREIFLTSKYRNIPSSVEFIVVIIFM